MTAKEFLKEQGEGYIAGDYTPPEVYTLMEDYATLKMIEENKSILEMAKLHMDTRAILILNERISTLEPTHSVVLTFDCKVCGKPYGDKLSLYYHHTLNH
jgi:hypothetical protein